LSAGHRTIQQRKKVVIGIRVSSRAPREHPGPRHGGRQIAINAGEDGSVIVGKILEKDQYTFGFDSQTGEYGNLVNKGIIDPTKVVRVAIQNAASVAALLIGINVGDIIIDGDDSSATASMSQPASRTNVNLVVGTCPAMSSSTSEARPLLPSTTSAKEL
jgi:chaperonin GroEL (HSP60 family)